MSWQTIVLIWQAFLLIAACAVVGIPIYFLIGKIGLRITAVLWSISIALEERYWSFDYLKRNYKEFVRKVGDNAEVILKIFWPIFVCVCACLFLIGILYRIFWLIYKAGEFVAMLYYKIFRFCLR